MTDPPHPTSRRADRKGLTRSGYVLATLATCILMVLGQIPANATDTNQSTNWSGVQGKPTVLGSSPVTHAQMGFVIPVLACPQKLAYVAIWTGFTGVAGDSVTQAGVTGECKDGKPTWYGWWEDFPSVSPQPIAALANLKSGDGVFLTVDYRPDLGQQQFLAYFSVDRPGKPVVEVSQQFASKHYMDRSVAECIVERPNYTSKATRDLNWWIKKLHLHIPPLEPGHKPIPKFTAADGSDFTASCYAGSTSKDAFIGSPYSTFEYYDLVSTDRDSHLLVSPWLRPDGLVSYKWFASQ